jgi:hypothetical protein
MNPTPTSLELALPIYTETQIFQIKMTSLCRIENTLNRVISLISQTQNTMLGSEEHQQRPKNIPDLSIIPTAILPLIKEIRSNTPAVFYDTKKPYQVADFIINCIIKYGCNIQDQNVARSIKWIIFQNIYREENYEQGYLITQKTKNLVYDVSDYETSSSDAAFISLPHLEIKYDPQALQCIDAIRPQYYGTVDQEKLQGTYLQQICTNDGCLAAFVTQVRNQLEPEHHRQELINYVTYLLDIFTQTVLMPKLLNIHYDPGDVYMFRFRTIAAALCYFTLNKPMGTTQSPDKLQK